MMATRRPAWAFSLQSARQTLLKHFRTASLEGFGFVENSGDDQAIRAAGAVSGLPGRNAKEFAGPHRPADALPQPAGPWRSTNRAGGAWRSRDDPRRTPRRLAAGGAGPHGDGHGFAAAGRLGRQSADRRGRDPRPARGRRRICRRAGAGRDLHDALRRVYDVQRLLARVTTGRASPRDLSFLGRTLQLLPGLKAKLDGATEPAVEPVGGGRSTSAPICGASSTRGWPTTARWPAATADSSATVFTPRWTRCGSWPAAANSGSPAIRPKRPSGRASRR